MFDGVGLGNADRQIEVIGETFGEGLDLEFVVEHVVTIDVHVLMASRRRRCAHAMIILLATASGQGTMALSPMEARCLIGGEGGPP